MILADNNFADQRVLYVNVSYLTLQFVFFSSLKTGAIKLYVHLQSTGNKDNV